MAEDRTAEKVRLKKMMTEEEKKLYGDIYDKMFAQLTSEFDMSIKKAIKPKGKKFIMNILHLCCELNWNKISKNRQHIISGNRLINTNNTFMKKLIEEISIETKIKKIEWQQTKTWLLIHITKKTKKGDPINVIDGLADCIKQGIGIDDVEYSLIIDSHVDITANPKIDYWIVQGHEIQVELLISKFLQQGKI